MDTKSKVDTETEFGIRKFKHAPVNSGVHFSVDGNSEIAFEMTQNWNIDLNASDLQPELSVTAIDISNQDAIIPNAPYTFYDNISKRDVDGHCLFTNMLMSVSGETDQIDASPFHNIRRESQAVWERGWQELNALSLSGNSVAPADSNNLVDVSSLKTASATDPNSSPINLHLTDFSGFCLGRDFKTQEKGNLSMKFFLDQTRPAPFRLMDPMTLPLGGNGAPIAGLAYRCADTVADGGAKTLTELTLLEPQVWGATVGDAPFKDAQTLLVTYEDGSTSLAGNINRFKRITVILNQAPGDDAGRTVVGFAVGTFTADDDAPIKNITVQVMNNTSLGAVAASRYVANKTTTAGGTITSLVTSFTFTDAQILAQTYPLGGYLYCYLSADNKFKYKRVNVTAVALTGGAPNTGTLTVAAVTVGGNAEPLTNGFLIPGMTYDPDSVRFSYKFTRCNLVLVQNTVKVTPPSPLYMSWTYDPVHILNLQEQTFIMNIRPTAKLILILTPLSNGMVSVNDSVNNVQIELDEKPFTNVPLVPGSNVFNSIIMSRNYNALPMINLGNLVPTLPDDNDTITKNPMILAVYLDSQIQPQTIKVKFSCPAGSTMQSKTAYIFQLIEKSI